MSENETLLITMEALRLHDANNTCMSVKECAEFLGVHENTVLKKLNDGKIHGTYAGKWTIPKLQFLEKIVEQTKRKSPVGFPVLTED